MGRRRQHHVYRVVCTRRPRNKRKRQLGEGQHTTNPPEQDAACGGWKGYGRRGDSRCAPLSNKGVPRIRLPIWHRASVGCFSRRCGADRALGQLARGQRSQRSPVSIEQDIQRTRSGFGVAGWPIVQLGHRASRSSLSAGCLNSVRSACYRLPPPRRSFQHNTTQDASAGRPWKLFWDVAQLG